MYLLKDNNVSDTVWQGLPYMCFISQYTIHKAWDRPGLKFSLVALTT